MSYTRDVVEKDVYNALRSFILYVLGTSVTEVVRVPTNRVPPPKTFPFITMRPVLTEDFSWFTVAVSDPAVQPQTQTISDAHRYQIQIDAYGPTSGDLIHTLATAFFSPDAWDYFAALSPQGVYPMYAGEPHQSPFVDDAGEYEVRWIMDVSLQYNYSLSSTVQTASAAAVGITNVDVTYH